MPFFIAFCYISGTGMLSASAYFGLALGGIAPPPYEYFGGVIGGMLPTTLAVIGMLLLGLGTKFSRMAKEPAEPKQYIEDLE